VYLLFIDESGNPSLGVKNVSKEPCVIAGLAVPDGAWRPIDQRFRAIKRRYAVTGELKWRFFGSPKGPLAHLDAAQRDALRTEVYELVTQRNAIRVIAVIGTPSAYAVTGPFRDLSDGFYRHAIKCLSERFQYFLQDQSRDIAQTHNGLMVCDARERTKDQRLVEAMNELMVDGGPFVSSYANLVEGLFMADSRLSTGVQLADMVAGAIWHKEARGRSGWYDVIEPRIRRRPNGDVTGFGIIRIP
jgi:hypothetical protein